MEKSIMRKYKQRSPKVILADLEKNTQSTSFKLRVLNTLLFIGMGIAIYFAYQYSTRPININSEAILSIKPLIMEKLVNPEAISKQYQLALNDWMRHQTKTETKCYCYENEFGTQKCFLATFQAISKSNWNNFITINKNLKQTGAEQCVF